MAPAVALGEGELVVGVDVGAAVVGLGAGGDAVAAGLVRAAVVPDAPWVGAGGELGVLPGPAVLPGGCVVAPELGALPGSGATSARIWSW